MPVYVYECLDCKEHTEVVQKISEPPLKKCPSCGGRLKKIIAPTAFVLKGNGWYITDYPSPDRKKAMESDKPDKKAAATSAASASKDA